MDFLSAPSDFLAQRFRNVDSTILNLKIVGMKIGRTMLQLTLTFDLKKTNEIKTPPARAKKSATMTLYVPSELSHSDLYAPAIWRA